MDIIICAKPNGCNWVHIAIDTYPQSATTLCKPNINNRVQGIEAFYSYDHLNCPSIICSNCLELINDELLKTMFRTAPIAALQVGMLRRKQ